MAGTLDSITAVAERLTKLAGLVALALIVVAGLSYRAGASSGMREAKRRREKEGKPIFRGLSADTKPTLFWKDEKVLHGGIRGLVVIAILCSFVAFMPMFFPVSTQELPQMIAVMLGFPNIVAPFFVALATRKGLRWPAVFSIVMAAAAVLVEIPIYRGWGAGLVVQAVILLVQLLLNSYVTGMNDGAYSADFERSPRVEVVTVDGETIDELRLLESTDSECRFVRPDGAECLIPMLQIRIVQAKAARDN